MTFMMFAGLFGGLGMFIYGMHIMSEGLKIVAGNKMKYLLEALTSTRFKALICGIVVTIMVQSSSTTTVMVVGFVNASLMNLYQAAGIILGSNIGTTVMAQIIAFDITAYSPIFIGIGTMMALFAKKKNTRDWGNIILGFGILFYGISTMTDSVEPLKDSEEFIWLLTTYGKNQWIGLLVSAALTGVLQSSGAIIGLIQALALSGVFAGTSGTEAIQICIPIIIGSNIGTCVTALLSSIGTSTAAKDAAFIHLFVNIFGAVWVMALLNIINAVFPMDPIYQWLVDISGTVAGPDGSMIPNYARQIAWAHTLFNVANTVVLFPFLNKIVNLIEKWFPPRDEEKGLQLDPRLLNNPAVALGQVGKETVRLSELTEKNFSEACSSLLTRSEEEIKEGYEREDKIDEFEHGIQEFLINMNNLNMSQQENDQAAFYLECSHDLERIGDYSVNVIELAEALIEKEAALSETMQLEIKELQQHLALMLSQVTQIIGNYDIELCKKIISEEEEIDYITDSLKNSCVKHLHSKAEKVYPSFTFVDLLTNLERVGDHAHNIAEAAIDLQMQKSVNKIEEVIY
ncbi:MAG: Na/Pi cotransporter family protein [Eubacteriaceae bacterium]|jgi:phosphate:Na+ symporter